VLRDATERRLAVGPGAIKAHLHLIFVEGLVLHREADVAQPHALVELERVRDADDDRDLECGV
jgi:hypothetical protein